MKYLLVKEYPGSPAIGSVVEFVEEFGCYKHLTNSHIRMFARDTIEKYPEFWKPESD